MPAPRRLRTLTLSLSAVAVVVLSGCEKPTPGVSVNSGTTTLRSEALCWNEGDTTQPGNCRPERVQTAELPVREGRNISISVDPALSKIGWIPALDKQALVREPLKSTSYRFALPEDVLRSNPELQIYASDRVDGPGRGLWAISLRHQD